MVSAEERAQLVEDPCVKKVLSSQTCETDAPHSRALGTTHVVFFSNGAAKQCAKNMK